MLQWAVDTVAAAVWKACTRDWPSRRTRLRRRSLDGRFIESPALFFSMGAGLFVLQWVAQRFQRCGYARPCSDRSAEALRPKSGVVKCRLAAGTRAGAASTSLRAGPRHTIKTSTASSNPRLLLFFNQSPGFAVFFELGHTAFARGEDFHCGDFGEGRDGDDVPGVGGNDVADD